MHDLITHDGLTLTAYQSSAEKDATAGVVLLHEIFGLTDHMRELADDYSALGYRVIVPALFDRVAPGHSLTYNDADRGRELAGLSSPKDVVADIETAVKQVAVKGHVALIGYGWGATFAFLSACKLNVSCAVSYYGTRISNKLDNVPKCPMQFHFGKSDPTIGAPDRKKIIEQNSDHSVYVYPGAGHAFACKPRPTYEADSARLAFKRSKAFLQKKFSNS